MRLGGPVHSRYTLRLLLSQVKQVATPQYHPAPLSGGVTMHLHHCSSLLRAASLHAFHNRRQRPCISAHPLMAPNCEALAGDWLPVADAFDERVPYNGMRVFTCEGMAKHDIESEQRESLPVGRIVTARDAAYQQEYLLLSWTRWRWAFRLGWPFCWAPSLLSIVRALATETTETSSRYCKTTCWSRVHPGQTPKGPALRVGWWLGPTVVLEPWWI